MATTNPFYRSDAERQQLEAKVKSFAFTDPSQASKSVILIAGKEGVGKTHLACTMSEVTPVYVIDTEYRAQMVTRKFQNVRFATVRNFGELVVAVKHITSSQPDGTIILDSGSDLQTFAEIEYLERTEKEKVGLPWNWSEVWRLCNAVIDEIKFSKRFNLIITARMKEEYAGDRPTGKLIPRIYSTLPYKADVVLQVTAEKERKVHLLKNGFSGDLGVQLQASQKLPDIIRALSQLTGSRTPEAIPTYNTPHSTAKSALRKAS